jgi:hypothetical protein
VRLDEGTNRELLKSPEIFPLMLSEVEASLDFSEEIKSGMGPHLSKVMSHAAFRTRRSS